MKHDNRAWKMIHYPFFISSNHLVVDINCVINIWVAVVHRVQDGPDFPALDHDFICFLCSAGQVLCNEAVSDIWHEHVGCVAHELEWCDCLAIGVHVEQAKQRDVDYRTTLRTVAT